MISGGGGGLDISGPMFLVGGYPGGRVSRGIGYPGGGHGTTDSYPSGKDMGQGPGKDMAPKIPYTL